MSKRLHHYFSWPVLMIGVLLFTVNRLQAATEGANHAKSVHHCTAFEKDCKAGVELINITAPAVSHCVLHKKVTPTVTTPLQYSLHVISRKIQAQIKALVPPRKKYLDQIHPFHFFW